jgi:hypothetical protein
MATSEAALYRCSLGKRRPDGQVPALHIRQMTRQGLRSRQSQGDASVLPNWRILSFNPSAGQHRLESVPRTFFADHVKST